MFGGWERGDPLGEKFATIFKGLRIFAGALTAKSRLRWSGCRDVYRVVMGGLTGLAKGIVLVHGGKKNGGFGICGPAGEQTFIGMVEAEGSLRRVEGL